MELRCCCNPNLLLGHLPDPPKDDQLSAIVGIKTEVALPTTDGGTAKVEVGSIRRGWDYFPAYKSNEQPIDFFRKIVGFVEVGEWK
jgi:hypothetical protein